MKEKTYIFLGYFSLFFLVFGVIQIYASIYYSSKQEILEIESHIQHTHAPEEYILTDEAKEQIERVIEQNIPKTPLIPEEKEADDKKEIITLSAPKTPFTFISDPADKNIKSSYKESIDEINATKFFQSHFQGFPGVVRHEVVEPRGQMKNKTIFLSGNLDSSTEITQVAIHEIAHAYDIYTMKKGVVRGDPSDNFYQISWEEKEISKADSSVDDFVSGYASTNQYEDFAESFTFFLFYNEEFRERAKNSKRLQKKYDFFERFVFKKYKPYNHTEIEVPSYIWDVTKLKGSTTPMFQDQ